MQCPGSVLGKRLAAVLLVIFILVQVIPISTSGQSIDHILRNSDASASPCGKPHAAGISAHFIRSGGIERRFVLYIPAIYEGDKREPLVFDLHGSTSDADQELAITQMDVLADSKGFVVVAPEGLNTYWNAPFDPSMQDDVLFISDVIDAVEGMLCIDPTRIFATGFSSGARMVSQLACNLSDRIAAIAPVGGLRFPDHCESSVPIIAFHGTADPVTPYEGGGPDYWQTGVEQALDDWAEQNGCDPNPDQWLIARVGAKLRYTGCRDNNSIAFYRVKFLGHQWPGAPIDIGRGAFGPTHIGLDASTLIWQFFAHHQLS